MCASQLLALIGLRRIFIIIKLPDQAIASTRLEAHLVSCPFVRLSSPLNSAVMPTTLNKSADAPNDIPTLLVNELLKLSSQV
jgi:hypothetical protein